MTSKNNDKRGHDEFAGHSEQEKRYGEAIERRHTKQIRAKGVKNVGSSHREDRRDRD